MKIKIENKKKNIHSLLYRSLDGNLSIEERRLLNNALASSAELREEKERILAMREDLSRCGDISFKPFFADRVMNRIASFSIGNGLERFYISLAAFFRSLAITTAAVILLLLIYNIRIGDHLSSEESFFASDTTIQEIMNLPLF